MSHTIGTEIHPQWGHGMPVLLPWALPDLVRRTLELADVSEAAAGDGGGEWCPTLNIREAASRAG